MTDFSKPVLTDNYANLLPALQVAISDMVRQLEPTLTGVHSNIPISAVRWNAANTNWERYNGTSWVALPSSGTQLYGISISGNAATATVAANATGSTFATAATTAEGQLVTKVTGQSDAYLYNNATDWGLYSAAGGYMCRYTRSTGLFTFNGKATSAGAADTAATASLANALVSTSAYSAQSFSSLAVAGVTVQFGGAAATGYFQDATNTAIRIVTGGKLFIQNTGGASSYGYHDATGWVGNVTGNVTGGNYQTATNTTTVGAAAQSTALCVFGNTTSPAVMSFHRAGAYAINMGLDTDNVWRLGGWSNGTNVYRIQSDTVGNLYAQSNVVAYSDERLKKNWGGLTTDFVQKLATIKSGTYDRRDIGLRQAGVSAQALEKVLPEAVLKDHDGYLSVAYGNAALVACVELAKMVVALKAEVEELKGAAK